MEQRYKRTLYASYIGYITQGVVNNLAPLLFVIFRQEYGLSVIQIGLLVTFNFAVQILTDLLSTGFVDRIGYKPCIIAAHVFGALGLVGLSVFPEIFPPYAGLLLSVGIYAVGGGLLEVLISPIVQSLPTQRKAAHMSLLHSFYCWGQALVVILSTVFFRLAGSAAWRLLPLLWALVPAGNSIFFAFCPVNTISAEQDGSSVKKLFGSRLFWLFVILMLCSGASELAMSQWSSYFAETGLKVSKTAGDLLGPCMFAVLMGISRWFYGAKEESIPLDKYIVFSGCLCVAAYLMTAISPNPLISLIGCGICGLSVGIMWPGVFSLAIRHCPQGGTAMFALLALAGDVGCTGGPSLVGVVSQLFNGELKAGLLSAIVFPSVLCLCVWLLQSRISKRSER